MKKGLFSLFICICVFLCGCYYPQKRSATFFAMDTVMEISLYGEEKLLGGCKDVIYDLEKKLSVTDDKSDVYILNSNGRHTFDEDTLGLILRAIELCDLTGGAVDVTVYPLVKAWGFTTGEHRVPENGEISSLLSSVGYKKVIVSGSEVSLQSGMAIDLGAIAKGYASDKIVEYLKDNGVKSAIINLGGNVYALGKKPDGSPWRVAVENPFGGGYIGILSVEDKCVITSGSYERFFTEGGKTYCHIIDPSTGYPADNGLVSVSVICSDGTFSDALSTALFVMGKERAIEFYKTHVGFDVILVEADGSITISEGIENTFERSADIPESSFEVIS